MCLLQGTGGAEARLCVARGMTIPSILAGAKEGVSARTCFPWASRECRMLCREDICDGSRAVLARTMRGRTTAGAARRGLPAGRALIQPRCTAGSVSVIVSSVLLRFGWHRCGRRACEVVPDRPDRRLIACAEHRVLLLLGDGPRQPR